MSGYVKAVTISLGLFTYGRFGFVKSVKFCSVMVGWVALRLVVVRFVGYVGVCFT